MFTFCCGHFCFEQSYVPEFVLQSSTQHVSVLYVSFVLNSNTKLSPRGWWGGVMKINFAKGNVDSDNISPQQQHKALKSSWHNRQTMSLHHHVMLAQNNISPWAYILKEQRIQWIHFIGVLQTSVKLDLFNLIYSKPTTATPLNILSPSKSVEG